MDDTFNRDHLKQVTDLLKRLGSEESQAEIMAKQLLKRAKQIAKEREITELEALENLLKQVVEARQGL